MSSPIVSLEDVAVRRPGALVLREVTLRLEPGESLGVFGANGSGKTTLLRVLATLLRPAAGVATVLGARLGTDEVESVRPRIGLVGHEPALAPHLTLAENLHLVADLAAIARERADAALVDVGLAGAADRRVVHCSNGMRRRVEFARILMLPPDLLLLDEAHVGLDPEAALLVAHVVAEVTGRGGVAVLVSHERERVAALISRAVQVQDGLVTAGGGMIRHTRVLLAAHLRDERRAGEVGLVILPFGVVALLVIPMAIGIETPLLDRIGPGLFWAVLVLFGVVVTQRQSATVGDARRDLFTLLGVDPAARFAAAAVAGTILLIIFAAVIGLVAVVLYDPTITGAAWLALIVPLACAGIAMVGTLATAVVGGLGTRSSLAPLLVVPISVPILLAAAQATEGLRAGAGILRWILLLAVVDVVLAMAGVLTARPLEES